jgi:hypothetical protein
VQDFAALETALGGGHLPLRGRGGHEHLARLRRGLAQRVVPVAHAPGAARTHRAIAPERVRRLGRDHGDPLDVDAQFIGDDHRVAGVRALPHLRGGRMQSHAAVGRHLEVGRHRGQRLAGRAARHGAGDHRLAAQRHGDRDRERPGAQHEIASGEHGQPSALRPAIRVAARATAASMRG